MPYQPSNNVRVIKATEGTPLEVGKEYKVRKVDWTGHLWLELESGALAFTEPSRVELVVPPLKPPPTQSVWLPM